MTRTQSGFRLPPAMRQNRTGSRCYPAQSSHAPAHDEILQFANRIRIINHQHTKRQANFAAVLWSCDRIINLYDTNTKSILGPLCIGVHCDLVAACGRTACFAHPVGNDSAVFRPCVALAAWVPPVYVLKSLGPFSTQSP